MPSSADRALAGRALEALAAHERARPPGAPEVEADDAPEARYERLELLGQGGMATVWRARDRLLGREVALKVLRPEVAHDPLGRERFRREAQALARLEHPHLVRCHELVEVGGAPALVLELVRGEPLSAALAGGRLDVRRGAALLEQVARAVHAAHEQGVVHRDLKPANVLVGADGAPKVADFGVALLLGGETRLTRTGALVGTWTSMAPEQVLGRGEVGPATDVYALGVMLYELLDGAPPLHDGPLVDLPARIVRRRPRPPRTAPDTPPGLARVALRALAKAPR
ncbi:MAG: serine/threonine protein kinase, partial [Planctomycetes bacterium]|nr:serine/threonine protein kinase [Planctomycetota bacterium]